MSLYFSSGRLEEKRSKSASPLCCSCDYRSHCNTRARQFQSRLAWPCFSELRLAWPRWETGGGGGVLLKSTIISTILSVLSSRLLRLSVPDIQLLNPLSVSRLVTFLNEAEGTLDVQSLVYSEKSSGERTQPWGAPVLILRVLDESFPSLSSCCLSVIFALHHAHLRVTRTFCEHMLYINCQWNG